MLEISFNTEEKQTKTERHKKVTFKFTKKSQKLFTYIIKLIKSLF